MGTCCTYFNSNIDNQNIHFYNNQLHESEKRISRLKSKPSILREKELVTKCSLSKKDTNAIEEKENNEESIQLSECCSSMKEEYFKEITECNKETLLLSDNIPPIETREGNSGFINKEDFDFNECICNTCIKEEKKKSKECNFFNKNKCKSLKRFSKKSQLTIKDSSSCETNIQRKKPYKRSRMKLLTN